MVELPDMTQDLRELTYSNKLNRAQAMLGQVIDILPNAIEFDGNKNHLEIIQDYLLQMIRLHNGANRV